MAVLDLGQVVGPPGEQGKQGIPGPQGGPGPQGNPGANGITPNIQVGTVTTLPPGSDAYFTRQEDSPDAAPVFNVGLPRGADSVNDGDMKASMYDPQGKGEDIFAYAMPKSGGEFTGTVSGISPANGATKGFRNIYFGSNSPASSLGSNGDIYINIG